MTLLTSGWYGRRLSGRIRLRRSTVILLVVFVVLGLLYLQTRPDRPSAEGLALLWSARVGVFTLVSP